MLNKKTMSNLGCLSWLWMNSPLHREWRVETFAKFILPPLHLNQFIIIEREGFPVAYCSWAFLSDEASFKYLNNPSNIELKDWKSGPNLWFIDWVAPFSKSDTFEMRSRIKELFPNSVARAIRVKKTSNKGRVMEFKIKSLDKEAADSMLEQQYQQFFQKFLKIQG
jgi:cytolysin-activating lysine-acyltransferase